MTTDKMLAPYRRQKAYVGEQNRKRGEAFEFRVLSREKRNSLFAVRSAGSHSLVDIISRKKNGKLWYISCKSNGYHTPAERSELRKLKDKLTAQEILKLAYYTSSKKWVYETL